MSLPEEEIHARITAALEPSRFFLPGSVAFVWTHTPAEEVVWEIFHGRLLDAAQTRERETFTAWNVFLYDTAGRSSEPLLSVKLDAAGRMVHVVRAIYCYAWEGYDAGDNVILSRETRKWQRELVGSLDLASENGAALSAWLDARLTAAVVGLSRLPLTSLEAPLPAFTLGELAYFPSAPDGDEPMRSLAQLLDCLTVEQPRPLKARLLEVVLRSTPTPNIPAATEALVSRWRQIGRQPTELSALLLTLFDDVALSPYTDFVQHTLTFLQSLEQGGHWSAADHADFLGTLLRRLVRHLTAFDLHTFHHRGANYPDALLLDAALEALLLIGERRPELFHGKEQRLLLRAVRQAVLLRCWYEGHPVPDQPTSPGENNRVLPPQFPRVPDEQITEPSRRRRKLYDGEPLRPRLKDSALLRAALRELDEPAELQELGVALFLDRPLGIFKRPGEPDPTPLLSYEAFSRRIAERRLEFLAERFAAFAAPEDWQRWREMLRNGLTVAGLPVQPSPRPPRPGAASLADALRVSDDFLLLRTTRRSAQEFVEHFGLQVQLPELPRLIVGGAAIGKSLETLYVYDAALFLRLELPLEALTKKDLSFLRPESRQPELSG